MKITITCLPLSRNKLDNMHWSKRREEKMAWEWFILEQVKKHKLKPFKDTVVIHTDFYFKDKRRHDSDNLINKGFFDGLVKAGIIKDDNIDVIKKTSYCGIRSNVDKTVITIKEG